MMKNFMLDLCVGSLMAGSAVLPQFMAAGTPSDVAIASAGNADAKYLAYPV